MDSNLKKYKSDLKNLLNLGKLMLADIQYRKEKRTQKLSKKAEELSDKLYGKFEREYQAWYTESQSVIKQIIPRRFTEFDNLYLSNPKRKKIEIETYSIQDWLYGFQLATDSSGKKAFNDIGIVYMKFNAQMQILKSAETRFVSSLFDIRQIVQADLFDSELETSRELLKKGFLRGAGAISGVVLEKHLREVCNSHSQKIKKRKPTISDLNDLLKNNNVIDIPTWRYIQRLGDIRNLCDHNGEREPTKEELSELIDGVDKISKTIF